MIKLKKINFKKKDKESPIQVGGQPTWLNAPEWPRSKSKNLMTFYAQIDVSHLLETTTKTYAYLFLTQGEENAYQSWSMDKGENAVILQQEAKQCNNTKNIEKVKTGKSIQQLAIFPETIPELEPTYNNEDEQVALNEKDKNALMGSKLGGHAGFLQNYEYPLNLKEEQWDLLLQLDQDNCPITLNFGDNGIGYLFINKERTQAKFCWQST